MCNKARVFCPTDNEGICSSAAFQVYSLFYAGVRSCVLPAWLAHFRFGEFDWLSWMLALPTRCFSPSFPEIIGMDNLEKLFLHVGNAPEVEKWIQ